MGEEMAVTCNTHGIDLRHFEILCQDVGCLFNLTQG